MKVTYKKEQTTRYDTLVAGDIFRHNGLICIKTQRIKCNFTSIWYDAIEIENGTHVKIKDNAKVELLDCELIIN